MTERPHYLGAYWPLFILGQQGRGGAALLSELAAPEQPADIRRVFGPILERTNPAAAQGLTLTEDAELAYWGRVFRAPFQTGAEGEGTFLPAWLTHEGQTLRGLAQLIRLPFYERLDVFLLAMHQRGLS